MAKDISGNPHIFLYIPRRPGKCLTEINVCLNRNTILSSFLEARSFLLEKQQQKLSINPQLFTLSSLTINRPPNALPPHFGSQRSPAKRARADTLILQPVFPGANSFQLLSNSQIQRKKKEIKRALFSVKKPGLWSGALCTKPGHEEGREMQSAVSCQAGSLQPHGCQPCRGAPTETSDHPPPPSPLAHSENLLLLQALQKPNPIQFKTNQGEILNKGKRERADLKCRSAM